MGFTGGLGVGFKSPLSRKRERGLSGAGGRFGVNL